MNPILAPNQTPLSETIQRAENAFAAGDFETAERCLITALDCQPQRADLMLLLGHTYLERKEFETGLRCYDDLIALHPNLAPAESSRALALQILGRGAEAQTAAERALALDAEDSMALKVLVRIHLDSGRSATARQLCERLMALDPADEQAGHLIVQCQAACPKPLAPVAAPGGRSDLEVRQQLDSLLETEGFRRLQTLGYHVQKNDYYSPLNDCQFLEANRDLWEGWDTPAGIDWRVDEQLRVAEEVANFVPELRDVPINPPADDSAFGWKNNFWENADAIVQYGLVRSRRPARYVEIGCGWSTLLLKKALALNAREGCETRVTLIEPYPNPRLFKHFPAGWKNHRSILQRAPFEIFDQLEAGDVLFYDGSHCAKVASDVNWFFFKILPRLKPGVIIHLHDISLPMDYPPPWIFERGQTWNEQYVLQAFLMHNTAYRILIANRHLFCNRPRELEKLYQGIQPTYGSSFWMEKLPATALGENVRNVTRTAGQSRTNHSPCVTVPAGPFTVGFPSRPASAAPLAAALPEQLNRLQGLLGDYTARCETWADLGPEHLSQQIVVGNFSRPIEIVGRPAPARCGSDGLPVPPADLTMGYGAGNLDHYLACGKTSYQILQGILRRQKIELNSGDAMLDWGGAAGRVVRNFTAEARRGVAVWGCDVHAPSIQWAQNNLSPTFNFFNSSSLPHLPFADGTFKFIYAFSVMTHLIALRDLWLLELRRILRPDGCLILTVHDENTWTWFRQHGMPAWMPNELRAEPEMPGECVDIRGSRWEHCYTFFHSEYLRRIWGQYFDIREIIPCADSYQAAVVMRHHGAR